MNILIISPHPDDEAIGCGGAIRKHVVEGDEVEVVFLTSGEKGGRKEVPEEEIIQIREKESLAAKEILGIKSIEFWRMPDGNVKVTPEIKSRLNDKIKSFLPDLIFVPHEHEAHPDHQAAAEMVRKTVLSMPVGIKKPFVYMYEVWTPIQKIDHIVDITDIIELKRSAIKAYVSQCELVRFDEAIISLNRYRGEMFSWPEGDYAEVFEKMIL